MERIALRDGHTCRTGEFEDAAVFGELEEAAFFALCLYDWPQNVRELENVLREAVLHSEGRREIRGWRIFPARCATA